MSELIKLIYNYLVFSENIYFSHSYFATLKIMFQLPFQQLWTVKTQLTKLKKYVRIHMSNTKLQMEN